MLLSVTLAFAGALPGKGLLTVQNASLRKIILVAYDIQDDRTYAVIGPGWLTSEHFETTAR